MPLNFLILIDICGDGDNSCCLFVTLGDIFIKLFLIALVDMTHFMMHFSKYGMETNAKTNSIAPSGVIYYCSRGDWVVLICVFVFKLNREKYYVLG